MIVQYPDLTNLFEAISQHVLSLQSTLPSTAPEPSSKKRKLESHIDGAVDWNQDSFFNFNDISFSIPQRKKLRLDIGKSSEQGIRATNPAGETESFCKWSDVLEIVCLPVPEKAQAQYNFCVFSASQDGSPADQMLWTIPDTEPKEGTVSPSIDKIASGKYRPLLLASINQALKPHKKRVTEPTNQEFASQLAQAHRKGETAYHIKGFRGAKDGFLFLLSTGIIWGFKKPLEFFPFDVIDSISYTSVLQRTFNLNITSRSSADAEPQEFEFSMIDQADFAGIDGYVKRHGLQDASMAEQRRAKKLNVNGVKSEDGIQEDGENEGELEKAAREAQNLEDEDEEDDENFDPGSEGESEGEGSSSEEDELANGHANGVGGIEDEEMGSEEDGE